MRQAGDMGDRWYFSARHAAEPVLPLDAATSGEVTFFRTIGGSFGVSVFGAIFANQLARQRDAALAGKKLPPGFNPAAVQSNSAALKTLPAGLHEAIQRLFAAKQAWLRQQMLGWSPEQHAELEHILSKLSRAMLGEENDRHLAAR